MNNIEAAEILEKAMRCVRSDPKACTEHCNDCVHDVSTEKGVEALTIAIKTLKGLENKDEYISIKWLEERASEFKAKNTYANNFAAGFLEALIRDWRSLENG